MVLAAALVLSCVPIQAGASEKTDKIEDELGSLKSENADIQAEIDAVRQQYTAASNQIQDLVNRKNAVDQEIALLHSQILNINQQVIAYGQLIADAQDDMDEESQRLDELNEKHKARIRAMEEGGTVSYWEVLFQASSFTDFLDRMAMIEEIAQSDQRRLEEIQQAADDLSSTQAKMQQELRSLAEAQQTLADSESLLAEKRTESDGLLRSLAAQKEEFELLLDDSEAKQDALMKEIAQKEKELANAQYEEKLAKLALQGQNPPSNATWITPVSGYTITSAFGMRIHPVYKYALMHNGIDMACPQGTPIYATRAPPRIFHMDSFHGSADLHMGNKPVGPVPENAGNHIFIRHNSTSRLSYQNSPGFAIICNRGNVLSCSPTAPGWPSQRTGTGGGAYWGGS